MYKRFITVFLFLVLVFSTTPAAAESTMAVAAQESRQEISGLNPSAAIDMSGSFNSGDFKRGFAIPGMNNFSLLPFPQYFKLISFDDKSSTMYYGPEAPLWQFRSVRNMLSYGSEVPEGKVFSITQLKRMAKDEWWMGWLTRDPKLFVTPINPRKPTGKYMFLVFAKPKNLKSNSVCGNITATAINNCTLSDQLMARTALAAYELGANVIHFYAEGAERRSDPKGVGVSGDHAHSTINGGGEATGNVSSGMLGISYGSAGYFDRPWTQATTVYLDPKSLPFPPSNSDEGNISSNTL